MPSRFAASGRPSSPAGVSGSGCGSVVAFWILRRIVSASSVMFIREYSEGSRLAHLRRAVAQRHDAGRRTEDQRLWNRKQIDGEVAVELLGDVPSQFQVLLLVLADGNVRRLVEENVGRHQVGVGIEADRGILLVLARLLLELCHPVEPSETGDAVEDPGELRMCGDLALVEDDMRPAGRRPRPASPPQSSACWGPVPAGPAKR